MSSNRCQRQFRDNLALGPPEVGNERDVGPGSNKLLKRGEMCPDTSVIGYVPILHGNIEIYPYQNFLAFQFWKILIEPPEFHLLQSLVDHVLDQINDPAAVCPFVVIPGKDLHHVTDGD